MKSVPQDIYSVVARFYDHVELYRKRRDISFFVEMARESGGPVLEIGCGTGRILIPTARAGIETVGLDISASMLAVCREKLARESKEVQERAWLVQADMRSFDLGQRFRLITTPFRPFQHLLNVADQRSCLASVREHLAEDGKLILDLFNPDVRRLAHLIDSPEPHREEEPEFTMPDGSRVTRRITVSSGGALNQILDLELNHDVTYPDGRTETLSQRFSTRYFFRFEVEHLLELSGFRIENVYADYDKSPLGSTYPGELIFIATRKK
ncbi:MAG: class I SAM-dependent methyltransferase [Candidatus Abyssobacteria bacterium SURF_5]|uniref:Class I SAM-dependent methyltransferase n=1 Tax=Abyssobacteria bacterium (strain SURF_5) TaxID=2093360 RepID=A0A3A4N8W1_ABYX5|nr:MAG: class I SAM-dependent methyltransferase [Candidatus Abyssubacteria bacterium SURF_5]